MENIPEKSKEKIRAKLFGIALVRSMESIDSKITIPELRYVLGIFRIGKRDWFMAAKELESDGIIRMHGRNPIEVLIKK